jgi:hypothetical protein
MAIASLTLSFYVLVGLALFHSVALDLEPKARPVTVCNHDVNKDPNNSHKLRHFYDLK